MNPSNAAALRARHVERCGSRVKPDDVDAALGQEAREGASSATDVQRRPRAEPFDKTQIEVEVPPVAVERIVDPCEPRMGEKIVGGYRPNDSM